MENRELSNFLGVRCSILPYSAIRVLGYEKTGWLMHLLNWRRYLLEKNEIDQDDFFYITQEKIKKDTGLSIDKQTRFISFYQEIGVIEIKRLGLPAKNYYRLSMDKFIDYVEREDILDTKPKKDTTPSLSNLHRQEYENYLDNKVINNKVVINKSIPKGIEGNKFPANDPNLNKELYKFENDIFVYWNETGSPLTKHRENTKTYQSAIKAISREKNKGYLAEEIADAIDLYSEMLRYPDKFILSVKIPGHKVSLPDFFGLSKSDKENLSDNNVAKLITSWFTECCKGKDYLIETYGRKPKQPELIDDKHPKITEKLKELWKEAGLPNSRPQDENCFRKSTVMFVDWLKENGDKLKYLSALERVYKPETLVKYLIEAIQWSAEDNDEIKVHAGWLCTNTMFNQRLTDYFLHVGVMDDGRE